MLLKTSPLACAAAAAHASGLHSERHIRGIGTYSFACMGVEDSLKLPAAHTFHGLHNTRDMHLHIPELYKGHA